MGLIGLVGIPILILIYIIKNKYTEQIVSSTYIWNYSEKFLKRRKKLPKIAGLISLILQLLAVTLISFMIAHPVFTFPNAADEYCFIIDGSGSMQIKNGEKTRFEVGKEKIAAIIDDSMNGGLYTLIYVGDDMTSVVYEREDDKEKALLKLSELTSDFGDAPMKDALSLAQEYFYENRALRTVLVTDKGYETHNNVEVINLVAGERNVSLLGAEYSTDEQTGALNVIVTATAYTKNADVNIAFYLDGEDAPFETVPVSLAVEEPKIISVNAEIESFRYITVRLLEDDALTYDNELVLYNEERTGFGNALIVSETPFFFKTAFETVSGESAVAVTPERYEKLLLGEITDISAYGYGLYIFDSYTPPAMPKDGAVWLVNQSAGMPDSGFSVQGEVTMKKSDTIDLTDSTSSLAMRLTKDMRGDSVHIYKYVKYGLYSDFTTVYSYNKQPLVFVGNTPYGNREVVFAFSLHDSNFALMSDFIPLMRNLVEYSFPSDIEKTNYTVGEKLEVNVPLGCTEIKIESPMGGVEYYASSVAVNELVIREPGIYTLTLTVGGSERAYNVYAGYCESEARPSVSERSFDIVGDSSDEGRDGIYDDLIIFAIVLAVIMILDWGIYCYDKYQLR